jgi:AraC-like DNA-binding protein
MQSDGKIGEIAIDSGFYDQSHFNRTFRKLLGVTPKQFRNYTRG